MKLENTARKQKVSKNWKRFFTSRDMAIAKHDEAALNGKVKRGELKRGKLDYIAVCSCGREGCFIHSSTDFAG
jgi:hypothetical protein